MEAARPLPWWLSVVCESDAPVLVRALALRWCLAFPVKQHLPLSMPQGLRRRSAEWLQGFPSAMPRCRDKAGYSWRWPWMWSARLPYRPQKLRLRLRFRGWFWLWLSYALRASTSGERVHAPRWRILLAVPDQAECESLC